MTRLGYQIPNFNYPNVGPEGLFDAVAAQARAADRSGFDTVFVMDHFYQLPGIGDPDAYMLECYTLLAALARETEHVRLSALVTGNTYRNPAVLAKIVTTLDLVSNGRAMLAIGSGWFELEHDSFGIEFESFTERFEKLEEALQIILPMLRDERPSLAGKHYQVTDAINQPPPVSDIPVMVGGNGEKKTLRMVAQYATDGNLTCERNEIPRKVEALAEHCDRLGRDRSEITLSHLTRVLVAPTVEEAEADLHEFLASRGDDPTAMSQEELDFFKAIFIFGDADSLAEAMTEEISLGIEGFTFNAVANGHKPERIEFLGEAATKILG